jgi:hypothetical protein
MVFDWHRHSRIVPVYELSLNRDLTNSELQKAEELFYSA